MGETRQVWFRLEGGQSHGCSGSMEVPVVSGWLLAPPTMLCAPDLGNGWFQLGRVANGELRYIWTEGFPDRDQEVR
jgi:hypothetical protein